MPAVAINLCGIACTFTIGAAILGALLNSTIAGRVLTRSSFFIVGHLYLSLVLNLMSVDRMLLYLMWQLVNQEESARKLPSTFAHNLLQG
jgi:hypothetical protein